jgi:Tfp pilus assembly protein PilX
MNSKDQMDADEVAVEAAKAALDAAEAKLKDSTAKYAAVEPHLTVLAQIEEYAISLPAEVKDAFLSLMAKAKALL